jgi:hypothetical protein
LAGESSSKNVNCSSPGLAVEGADVIPDWEVGKDTISLPGEEDISWVLFDFTSSDWIVAK